MKTVTKGLISCLIPIGILALLANQAAILYSETHSLPYHWFLQLKHVSPQKGHYTCFESSWYGEKLVKEIVGVNGDTLTYDQEGNLWVGKKRAGKPQKQAQDGRNLSPIKEGVIPEGFVFVKGNHERSFDSRYEELGLVPVKALQGRVVGIR